MKWVIGVGGLWLVIILGLLIYNHSLNSVGSTDSPQEHKLSQEQIDKGGPVVGDEIQKIEKPDQVITRYLQYINDGDINNASALVEPNTLLEYTSKQKELSSHDAVEKFVTLYSKKSAQHIQIIGVDLTKNEAKVTAEVKFNSMKARKFSFELSLITEDSHHAEQYWLIIKEAEEGAASEGESPGYKVESSNIIQPDTPSDKVKLFLTLLNEGKLDGAAALFDPNTLMVALSNQQEKDPRKWLEDYVQIFKPGDMLSFTATPIDSTSNTEKDFLVTLKTKQKIDQTFTFYLVNIIVDSATDKNGWYIKNVVHQP